MRFIYAALLVFSFSVSRAAEPTSPPPDRAYIESLIREAGILEKSDAGYGFTEKIARTVQRIFGTTAKSAKDLLVLYGPETEIGALLRVAGVTDREPLYSAISKVTTTITFQYQRFGVGRTGDLPAGWIRNPPVPAWLASEPTPCTTFTLIHAKLPAKSVN